MSPPLTLAPEEEEALIKETKVNSQMYISIL